MDDIEVKKEGLDEGKLLFSTAEDGYLKAGIEKYKSSRRKWSDIMKDPEFKFREGRTRDALRMRASTLGLEKTKPKGKAKLKS